MKFTVQALSIEPRLQTVDFNFDEVYNISSDSAFLSGAIVEGFGNESSDVDIYIVATSNDFDDGRKINYTNSDVGYYNEINIRSRKNHIAIRDKVNSINTVESWQYFFNVQVTELSYYYRVCISAPLFENDCYLFDVEGFDKETVAKHIEYYYGYRAFRNAGFAKLFFENNALEKAQYYANQALSDFIDSLAASLGECYISKKYRYRKLARIFNESEAMFTTAKLLRYRGSMSMAEYCKKVFDFIKSTEIGSFSLLKFYYDPLDIFYIPIGKIVLFDFVKNTVVLDGNLLFTLDEESQNILQLIVQQQVFSRKLLEAKHLENNGRRDIDDILDSLHMSGLIELFDTNSM